MILSNDGILKALEVGDIEIDPAPSANQYTTSAVDLMIGNDFKMWDDSKLKLDGFKGELDLSEQKFATTARAFTIQAEREKDGSVVLPPYRVRPSHLLAVTRERIHLKREAKIPLAARVEGRSSLARIGLMVHLTAPTIHCGFDAPITLEIINFSPFYVKFVPDRTPVCQLIFETLQTAPTIDINTAFQHQKGPTG